MTDCSPSNNSYSPTSMATSLERRHSQESEELKEENQQCLSVYNSNDMGGNNNQSQVDDMEEYNVLQNHSSVESSNDESNQNNPETRMSSSIHNHGDYSQSDSPKEHITTQRSPVIASHMSMNNVNEVASSPVINNGNEMLDQKESTSNTLSTQMLSRSDAVDLEDESQDCMSLKQNDQIETDVVMEGLSRDQLPSDRIILHGVSYLHDGNKQMAALVNSYNLPRSSPSSVTAPVICMGPSINMNSAYDIPRGQGLPPVSTIIRSTSMARYDRGNMHSMNNSHSSILQLPTTESLHALDISRMNIMADDSLAPSNMSIRNMDCFSPHRSVLVTPNSHLRSSMMDHNSVVHQHSSPSPSHCENSKDDRMENSLENMHVNHPHIQDSKDNSDNMMDEHEDDHHDMQDYEHSESMESMRQKFIATSVVSQNPMNTYTEHLKEFASSQFLPMAALGGLQTNRITPEMAEMLNSMVQKSVASLSRENNLDIGADMMGELIQSSIQSAPSSLIISPHQNQHLQRLIVNTGTSLSSDETSEGSSPLLSVDSDMECKVQDLTRRSMGVDRKHLMIIQGENHQNNSCIATHGTPQNLVQSFSRGVITSTMSGNILQLGSSNIGVEDLETSKSSEMVDNNGEAEDLSHRSKMNCSINMTENSGVIKSSEHKSQRSPGTSSPLQNVPSSMLPSFLSSLAGSSLASLSTTLAGIPLSLPASTTVHYSSPTDSSLQTSPTGISSAQQVILSNVSSSSGLSHIKQEPGNHLINTSCSISTTSGNVYTNLPNLQNMSPFIKQEVPSPSSQTLPPFPVISSLKRDSHNASRNSILSSQTTHPIMSVVQTTSGSALSGFVGSVSQLPPYSSMRVSALPPLSIPGASSSSDSPASSPMTGGIASDTSPISLSPGKKSEKFKEIVSLAMNSSGTMSTADVVNSMLFQGKEKEPRKWSCPMCRNGSPCGLHPTQMQMATSSLSPGPMPSGDPAKPYQCTVCGKNLASKNVFQLHMRSHSGEKPFRCNLCGHHFSQKTSLTRHMRSHTGERPFPCGVCGKRFADKERIKIHMRTHTGEKPFACEVCAKRFSQKSTVKRHMSVHTGEKPFKCDACGKGFANRGNLNAHAKTHANS